MLSRFLQSWIDIAKDVTMIEWSIVAAIGMILGGIAIPNCMNRDFRACLNKCPHADCQTCYVECGEKRLGWDRCGAAPKSTPIVIPIPL